MTIAIAFHDDEFRRWLQASTAEGLQRAGAYLASQCKIAVNKANPHHKKVKLSPSASKARGGQKTAKVYQNMHNQYAGKPPFARTGHGRDSIVSVYNGNPFSPMVRVGVTKNGIYMAYLELGTRKIKARPWLVAMLEKHQKTLGRLAVTGKKKR